MRVSPVNSYNQTNALAFGKFADKNARKVVRETLSINDENMQPMYDSWFKRIEDCNFFEAYTDKTTGKVKGRFTDEFVKENTSDTIIYKQRAIKNTIERLSKRGNLDDLSILKNLNAVAIRLSDLLDLLAGVDLSERARSSKPFGDAREDEREKEDFLNNLAD